MEATGRLPVLIDAVVPRSWGSTRGARLAVDAGLMVGFALFVALCAQVAVILPWTTVPITGQTFAVLVAGGALGAWRGAGSLLIYLFMGMVALPVYAPKSSALDLGDNWGLHLLFPWRGSEVFPWQFSDGAFIWGGSGGYIIGFVFAAWLVGWLAERGWDRKPWNILGMLGGNAVLYVPGLLWLNVLTAEGDWSKTLAWGLYPFIVGDLAKLYLASLSLPAAWKLVERLKRRDPDGDGDRR